MLKLTHLEIGAKSDRFINVTFTADVYNPDLKALALAQGWNGVDGIVTFIIAGSVFVGSTTAGTPSMDFKVADFPLTVQLYLINNGFLLGFGGSGGRGGWDNNGSMNAGNGTPGGIALRTNRILLGSNSGIIAGGGGGGGGGAGWGDGSSGGSAVWGGGGGGGGRGWQLGVGNVWADDGYSEHPGNSGANATKGSFGAGGARVENEIRGIVYGYSGKGGNGGDFGSNGQNGEAASSDPRGTPGTGGLAGTAVSGDSYIVWDPAGSIYGSRVG